MSKCMTIADESIDQKDTCTELAPKDIVEFILEEALLSALIISDKGCSRIGDFSVTEDFCQQYDRVPFLTDFEQVNYTEKPSATNQESTGKSTDRSVNLVTAKENLESLIDSFVKKEEKIRSGGECTIITEEILADNELKITNGQSHIEKNNNRGNHNFLEAIDKEYIEKKDVVRDEKIEIEYYNEGKLSKIYVPLIPTSVLKVESSVKLQEPNEEEENKLKSIKTEKYEPEETKTEKYELEGTKTEKGELNDTKQKQKNELAGKVEDSAPERTIDEYEVEFINTQVGLPGGTKTEDYEVEITRAEDNVSGETKVEEYEVEITQPQDSATEGTINEYELEIIKTQVKSPKKTKTKKYEVEITKAEDILQEEEKVKNAFEMKEKIPSSQSKPSMDEGRHFKPFSTEEFRQVFTDGAVDPNRPRACAFGEEDVKKIIKEIEEISLTQSHVTSEDSDLAIFPEGQGDADLESNTRSRDSLEKISKTDKTQELFNNSIPDLNLGISLNSDAYPELEEREVYTSEEILLGQQFSDKSILYRNIHLSSEKMIPPEGDLQFSSDTITNSGNVGDEIHLQYQVTQEEKQLSSKLYSDQMEEQTAKNPSQNYNEDFRNEYNARDPPFWEAAGNIRGSQQDLFKKKNSELTSERDIWTYCDNPADVLKASRSENDAQSHSAELKCPSQQSTVSMTILCPERLPETGHNVTSFVEKQNSETLKNMENNFPESDPILNLLENFSKSSQNVDEITESVNNRLQSPLTEEEDLTELNKRVSFDEEQLLSKEKQLPQEGVNSTFNQVALSEHESQKSIKVPEESGSKDTNAETSAFSQHPSQTEMSNYSVTEKESAENSDQPPVDPQNFRLRAPKMYSGVNHEPDSQVQQECTLTESEEAFIDEAESVLQIIEPEEHSEDENATKVSFSLLSEILDGEASAAGERESETEVVTKKNPSSDVGTSTKKIFSGMTTIGPLKNIDYDPKDLTLPNIDYGKMTRITSSRQLAKEIDLFGPELSSTVSVKILEDDSDDDLSLNAEDDRIDLTSLVNRDIASLTKVQKVREVMSHQPKPEDDFEDDDVLPRPRLDLKDVESMTDERYKVPDVTIPLLSLEISDSNGPEKELIENMGLVLSSLTNPAFYGGEFDTSHVETSQEQIADDYFQLSEEQDVDKGKSETSKTTLENINSNDKNQEQEEDILKVDKTESEHGKASSSPKYDTLGSVFRKASNKFIRKDSDSFLRNSKSLPRDTSKVTATESIRSILDDCQSSASNMLKKSKSLLKNTQSIFKSMSSSRVTSNSHEVDNKKVSPSESDVSTLERKLSSFLRKEDFMKAKNLIKSKVEKTLERLDSGSSTHHGKISEEKKNLTVVVRDEEKLRIDRIENFKKLLPKSPLVYKSQFVKSQISVPNDSSEVVEIDSNCNATGGEQNYTDETFNVPPVEEISYKNDRVSVEKAGKQKQSGSEVNILSDPDTKLQSESGNKIKDNMQWLLDREELQLTKTEENSAPLQPDYIVMETIQGLPTSDIDSPSREKNSEMEEQQGERETGNETKKTETFDLLGACADGVTDVAPCFPDLEEDKMAMKTSSERKIKTNKKKFTARFRSFWCSAFGRVKTPPKKGDCS